ncbi:MAG TPA: S41 family peptidase [Burkholderiales bacterium]|nr:S41 family peptidase [Burkholderiales bacterium]
MNAEIMPSIPTLSDSGKTLPGKVTLNANPRRNTEAKKLVTYLLELVSRSYVDPIDWDRLFTACERKLEERYGPASRGNNASTASDRKGKTATTLIAEAVDRYVPDDSAPSRSANVAAACAQGVVALLDTHSAFIDQEEFQDLQTGPRATAALGVELQDRKTYFGVVRAFPGTPASQAGIRAGDRVVAVDGKPVAGATTLQVTKLLRGSPGSRVVITLSRNEVEPAIDVVLTRQTITIQNIHHKQLDSGLLLLRIDAFNQDAVGAVANALQEDFQAASPAATGIILDLRDNAGGLLTSVVGVAAAFLGGDSIVARTKGRGRDSDMELRASPRYYVRGERGDPNANLPLQSKTLPMVVLVNGRTASGAEILAAALRDQGRAFVLGTPTFKLGTIQTILPLPMQSALKLTTSRVYRPNGRPINEGVVPDVALKNQERTPDFADASDPYLAEATRMLRPR